MLEQVHVGPRSLDAYRGIAPNDLIDDLLSASKDFKGARVAHLNATAYGGGVSELLRSSIPILNNLGLVAHWKTIAGDQRFFQVTKKKYNWFQVAHQYLTISTRK